MTFQLRAQLGEMFVVSRLNSATNMHGGDVRASKSTIMDDLFNACAAGCDLRGEIGKATWTIADHGSESTKATVSNETAFDHTTKHVGVDVSAAKQKDDAFARKLFQFAGHAGGEWSCSGAFDDALFQFDEVQNGEGDLFFGDGNR